MESTSTEPVADGAKIVAAVVGIVGGVCTILVIVGALAAETVPGLLGAVASMATGVVTVLGVIMPIWQARQVRELVTPLVAPRDQSGIPLVPVG